MFWPQRVFVRPWNHISARRAEIDPVETETVIIPDNDDDMILAVTSAIIVNADPGSSHLQIDEPVDTVINEMGIRGSSMNNCASSTEEVQKSNVDEEIQTY